VSPNKQATDPKSHTLVKSLLLEIPRYIYRLIPMVDPMEFDMEFDPMEFPYGVS